MARKVPSLSHPFSIPHFPPTSHRIFNMLVDLKDPVALMDFINSNQACLVTFSAVWCGPCKASKGRLDSLAKATPALPFGYVYESDLDDFLDIFVELKAFPTYIFFKDGQEVQRVEGVNFEGILEMLSSHNIPTHTT